MIITCGDNTTNAELRFLEKLRKIHMFQLYLIFISIFIVIRNDDDDDHDDDDDARLLLYHRSTHP